MVMIEFSSHSITFLCFMNVMFINLSRCMHEFLKLQIGLLNQSFYFRVARYLLLKDRLDDLSFSQGSHARDITH